MTARDTTIERADAPFGEVSLFLFFSLLADQKRFANVCLSLFIVLTPIQDFVLQSTPLRSLGISPAIFPLIALAALQLNRWLVAMQWTVSWRSSICAFYVLATSVYGVVIFGTTSHGENLLWKGTTSLISLLAIIFAAQLDYEAPIVRKALYVAFALICLGFFFGNSNPLRLPEFGENSVLHYTPLEDERPRGLASEPSQFSATATIIGLLAAHVTQSRRWKVVLFSATAFLLFASGSKGAILTLFICLVIIAVLKWHRSWYQVFALILVLFPLGLVLIWLIPNLFPQESFATSGTVATRFSMILCALMTAIHHPFGVGVTGFLPAVARYLPEAMFTIQSFFPFPLYFGEVTEYLTSADMVSTKTFFFDQLMRFGFPFVILFAVFIGKLLRKLISNRDTLLFIGVLFATIAVTTYQPGTGNFAISMVFGVALNRIR
jgi:hypothetical protein